MGARWLRLSRKPLCLLVRLPVCRDDVSITIFFRHSLVDAGQRSCRFWTDLLPTWLAFSKHRCRVASSTFTEPYFPAGRYCLLSELSRLGRAGGCPQKAGAS